MVVFDPQIIKTKSDLTASWNKAHGKEVIEKPSLYEKITKKEAVSEIPVSPEAGHVYIPGKEDIERIGEIV